MGFVQKIRSSIYNPAFYQEIPGKSFGSAIGYFFKLILIFVLLELLFLIKPLWVDLTKEITSFSQKTINAIPSDVSVTIKSGKVTTTAPEPYKIPFSLISDSSDKSFDTALVVDTKTPYSAEQFGKFNTVAWLTSDSLFIKSDQEIKTIELTKMPDVTIDKSFFRSIESKIKPVIGFIGPSLFLLAGFGILIGYTFRLWYLLGLSLLIFLIAKIARLPFTYGGIYKVGLHAMTLAFLVEFFVWKTSSATGFNGISFMFSIITLIVIVLNYRQEAKQLSPVIPVKRVRKKSRSKKA